MLTVSILGNGPSLKFFQKINSPNNLIIATNNIFFLKHFNVINQSNNFYTAYDERFFKKGFANWFLNLQKFRGKIFFQSSWKHRKELIKLKKINYYLPKKNYSLVKSYSKMFADTDNLKSSVVITRAIPLALSLGVKVINLYGCEFKYKFNSNSKLTSGSYFYKEKNYGFEHSNLSAQIWSKIQYHKLKRIKSFLSNHNITLKDLTINGNLKFI